MVTSITDHLMCSIFRIYLVCYILKTILNYWCLWNLRMMCTYQRMSHIGQFKLAWAAFGQSCRNCRSYGAHPFCGGLPVQPKIPNLALEIVLSINVSCNSGFCHRCICFVENYYAWITSRRDILQVTPMLSFWCPKFQ